MKITTNSDKIVSAVGESDISILSGKKYITNLNGTVTKNITLVGEKYMSDFSVLKDIIPFSVRKFIDDLEGEKDITTLLGEKDESPMLMGSGIEGFWHIRVDTTYFFADDTITTTDRN